MMAGGGVGTGASAAQVPQSQPVASWPASRLIHRPVVDARQAAQVGAVVDVVFSPEARQLVGLLVGTSAAEGGLLELARRLLGTDAGLVFVPMERVLALNGDVVMIESETRQSGELARPLPPLAIRHLPRVRRSLGFTLLTMQGQRLGHLDDLQLDAEGRRIKGYVVARTAPPPPVIQAAAPVAPIPLPAPQGAPRPIAPTPPPVAPPPLAPLAERFMIPVRFRVRFGRGLIVVGEDLSRPVAPPVDPGQSPEWPAPAWADEPQAPAPGTAASGAQQSTEPPVSPDEPTEQLAPPA